MTRWMWFVVTLLLVVTGSHTAQAVPREVASVPSASPGADYRTAPTSDWKPVEAGSRLTAGLTLRTGSSPFSFVLLEGATVRLEPNSLLLLRDPTQVDLRPGVTELAHRIDLKSGGLAFELPEGKQRLLFLVHTDEILGVFGHGSGQARIVPEGMLTILARGTARVASQGRWVDLRAGQYLTLGAPGAASKPKALAPAPRFVNQPCEASTSHCGIAVVAGAGQSQLAARWSPVAEASTYRVRVAADQHMTNLLVDESVSKPRSEFVTKPMPAGRYWLTVQSIGADGVPGHTTAPRPLRVVRLLLDQGVIFDRKDSVIVLPEGTQARISDVRGLAQSTTSGSAGVPSSVRLFRGQNSRSLKLFVENFPTDTASIAVERRQLRAEVSLTPINARWPKDTVRLRVRLHDPSKRLSATDVYPRIQARLNQTRLTLAIRHSGDTWTAQIPSRNGKGPWVLRVDVTDLDGRPLGHGFVEITGTGQR